jgi:hypothetical protein
LILIMKPQFAIFDPATMPVDCWANHERE